MITNKEIEKAKNTIYKHKDWFIGGNKTIYEAIKHFVEIKDFYIEHLPKYKKCPLPIEFINSDYHLTSSDFTKWLIENKRYNDLIIKYYGKEGGSDKGQLKIKLFLYLQNKEVHN